MVLNEVRHITAVICYSLQYLIILLRNGTKIEEIHYDGVKCLYEKPVAILSEVFIRSALPE